MPTPGPLRLLRSAAAGLLAFAGAFYILLCLSFLLIVHVFVATGGEPVLPQAAGLTGFAAVTVPTDDGERLSGWWSPPRPEHGAVLVLLGNGGVQLADMATVFGDLAARGIGVLGIEYRGNRGSTGSPSEAGVVADARGGFDFIRAQAPMARIAVYGQSFGTGVAVALAAECPVAGLVLDSPYASIAGLFERAGTYPLPYRLLLGDPLDSEARIGSLHIPILIVHGTADDHIPVAQARRLFAAAHQPKWMIEVQGAGHGGGYGGGAREPVLAALAEWTTGAPTP